MDIRFLAVTMNRHIDSFFNKSIHWNWNLHFFDHHFFICNINWFIPLDDIGNAFFNNLIDRFLNKNRDISWNMDDLGILDYLRN